MNPCISEGDSLARANRGHERDTLPRSSELLVRLEVRDDLIPDLLLRVEHSVGLAIVALHGDSLANGGVLGREDDLDLRVVLVGGREDHGAGLDAAHLSGLEVLEEEGALALEVLWLVEVSEAGDDGDLAVLLAEIDGLEEEGVCVGVLCDADELADDDVRAGDVYGEGLGLLLGLLRGLGGLGLRAELGVRLVGELLLALEGLADGLEELVDGRGHAVLEVLGEERLGREGLLQLGVGGVRDGAAELLGAVDGEGALPVVEGEQHHLGEAQEPVVGHVPLLAEGLLDLPGDRRGVVEKVDLAVLHRGGHLRPHEAGHHRVHEVRAALVAERGEVLLGEHKDLALVDAAELAVHVEVLLVQDLQARVEEAGEKGVLDLLHNLGAGLLRVVLGHKGRQTVDVEGELAAQLVVSPADKVETVEGDAHRGEPGTDDRLVVLGAVLEELPGGLHVVEVRVEVRKEDGHLAPSTEKIPDLRKGDKVPDVGTPGARGAPVDAEGILGCGGSKTGLDEILAKNLLKVAGDESVLLVDCKLGRHFWYLLAKKKKKEL